MIREDGPILTIGYLITEAHSVWLTTNDGTVVAGHPLAYDQVTASAWSCPSAASASPRSRAARLRRWPSAPM